MVSCLLLFLPLLVFCSPDKYDITAVPGVSGAVL